jgi:hypothetical protein
VEGARFEHPEASETIVPDLVSSSQSHSFAEGSEADEIAIKTDGTQSFRHSLATIDPMNAAIGFFTEVAAYSRPFCQSPSALEGTVSAHLIPAWLIFHKRLSILYKGSVRPSIDSSD